MKSLRSPQALVGDGVLQQAISFITAALDNVYDKRNPALIRVLCRLSEDDYQAVKTGRLWFLIPAGDQQARASGWHGRIPPNKSCVIYLSPLLENMTIDACVMLAAHEIAHFLLGHTDLASTPELEDQTWKRVIQMGFATQERIDELLSKLQEE